MAATLRVARQATGAIVPWLRALPQTVDVRNVEDDPAYRALDVDLLWTTTRRVYKVEIKADRYHRSGNFFFETHRTASTARPAASSTRRRTCSSTICPLTSPLHPAVALHTRLVRAAPRAVRERATTTRIGGGHYTTIGRLVPIARVLREVPNVRELTIAV